MKSFKRRVLYIGIIIFCLVSVAVRIQEVRAYRAKAIVSFYDQWQKFGKPVEVRTIEAQNIPLYAQFTVKVVDGQIARGFVTGKVKEALQEGQEIYDSEDKSVVRGRLKSVAADLDINTGMFPVEVEFNEPREPDVPWVVCAHTSTLDDVLALPNEALDISGGEYFIWKDKNGSAKKGKVTLSLHNGYGAIISEGLQYGEAVIFRGYSGLADNDKLLAVNTAAADKKKNK